MTQYVLPKVTTTTKKTNQTRELYILLQLPIINPMQTTI